MPPQKLCKDGVRYAAVSLGRQGALLTDGEQTVFASAVPVKASFTVGAGGRVSGRAFVRS